LSSAYRHDERHNAALYVYLAHERRLRGIHWRSKCQQVRDAQSLERRKRYTRQRDNRNAVVSQRIAERHQGRVSANTRSATRLRATGGMTSGRPLTVKLGLRLDRLIPTRRADCYIDSPRVRAVVCKRACVHMPTIVE
jgi:hypothetical protein